MVSKDTSRDMEGDARFVYGPRAVGTIVPILTREAFRKRSPAAAQLMMDWALVVGPELARVTTPKRLTRNTLTIGCAGPVAMELQYLSAELINRINAHLGSAVVSHLKFQQVSIDVPAVLKPVAIAPAVVAAAEAAVAGMAEGDLRTALAALGRAVLAGKTPSTSPRSNR